MSAGNNNSKSPHILNASSNLIGFSFILLTTIRVLNLPDATLIDEIAAIEILLFCASSLFSFMSLRSVLADTADRYEIIADYLFFIGLSILSLAAILLTFAVIK